MLSSEHAALRTSTTTAAFRTDTSLVTHRWAAMISVEELYAQTHMVPTGSTRWGDDVPSTSSGVYIISTEWVASVPSLPDNERAFWVPDRVIIYIGRAKQLRRRLRQFRRHVYGRTSPHRGGQAIVLLDCAKTITWAEVEDYAAASGPLLGGVEM